MVLKTKTHKTCPNSRQPSLSMNSQYMMNKVTLSSLDGTYDLVTESYNVGVVGCGRWGTTHLETLAQMMIKGSLIECMLGTPLLVVWIQYIRQVTRCFTTGWKHMEPLNWILILLCLPTQPIFFLESPCCNNESRFWLNTPRGIFRRSQNSMRCGQKSAGTLRSGLSYAVIPEQSMLRNSPKVMA